MLRAILSSGGSGATSPASTLVAAGAEFWVAYAPFAIKTSPGPKPPFDKLSENDRHESEVSNAASGLNVGSWFTVSDFALRLSRAR